MMSKFISREKKCIKELKLTLVGRNFENSRYSTKKKTHIQVYNYLWNYFVKKLFMKLLFMSSFFIV